ncbi:MAG TPA: hypothetical protein VJQ08_12175 [Candidatus Dormibacteraeota bacterium]|nr:hypothetical protein [Candidatus Dormibacteraeota bacterium]
MTPQQFAATYGPTADAVAAGTGLDRRSLLIQWADETGWATSWAGAPNNLGNIEINGQVVAYPSLAAFAQAAIATFHNGLYPGVLSSTSWPIEGQLVALGQSPWDAGHYDSGAGPGSALFPFAEELLGMSIGFTDQDRSDLVATKTTAQECYEFLFTGTDAIANRQSWLVAKLAELEAKIAAIAPEPPEPKNITLTISSVPGTATGTLS